MSYSIKIVDNDNGEVVIDTTESIAIIGCIADKTGAHQIGYTECGALELLTALTVARKAIREVENGAPLVKEFANYLQTLTDSEE